MSTDKPTLPDGIEDAISQAHTRLYAVAELMLDHEEIGEVMRSGNAPDRVVSELWGGHHGFKRVADRLLEIVEEARAGDLERGDVEGELMDTGNILHALAAAVDMHAREMGEGNGVALFARDVADRVRNMWTECVA